MLTWELLRPDALPLVRYICRVTWDISDCVADLALAAEQINTHLVAARSRGVVTGEESNFGEASDALGRVSSGLVEIRKELERAYFSAGALYDSLGEE